jgi:hypothetical protein
MFFEHFFPKLHARAMAFLTNGHKLPKRRQLTPIEM